MLPQPFPTPGFACAVLAMEPLNNGKDGLWRAPIGWQRHGLIRIPVWEAHHVCLDPPTELKRRPVNPEEVLAKHF